MPAETQARFLFLLGGILYAFTFSVFMAGVFLHAYSYEDVKGQLSTLVGLLGGALIPGAVQQITRVTAGRRRTDSELEAGRHNGGAGSP